MIDASTMPLGKLAVIIADKLSGKSKVTYTPHIDNGDYVVVINAKDVAVTGDKMVQKKYYRHSGYPGGLKELKRRVDNGEMRMALALYPVSMKQIMDIADSGNIMPPKATWFEPKLRSGLIIHKLS